MMTSLLEIFKDGFDADKFTADMAKDHPEDAREMLVALKSKLITQDDAISKYFVGCINDFLKIDFDYNKLKKTQADFARSFNITRKGKPKKDEGINRGITRYVKRIMDVEKCNKSEACKKLREFANQIPEEAIRLNMPSERQIYNIYMAYKDVI